MMMSDYMECRLADFVRGQGLTLPSAWFLTALSAWSDSSATEITGIGLSRVSKTRSLTNFAGTQGDGSTLASSGTTHTTSNNTTIPFGTATGSATMTHVGFFDAASGGNCWMAWQLPEALSIANTDVVTLPAGKVKFSLGLAGGMSDYLANKLIDLLFRGQAYSFPSPIYIGLLTGGVEVGGGVGYARASLTPSLTSLSGTQSAGSTVASSGTGGRTSNNALITFPQPTGSWSTPDEAGIFDAASAGNTLFEQALTSPTSIGASSPPPYFAPNALGITFS